MVEFGCLIAAKTQPPLPHGRGSVFRVPAAVATIDETQRQLIGDSIVGPADATNIKLDRVPARFGVNKNLTLNAIYKPPGLVDQGSKLGWLVNGWMASGIVSLRLAISNLVADLSPPALCAISGRGAGSVL